MTLDFKFNLNFSEHLILVKIKFWHNKSGREDNTYVNYYADMG